MLVPFNEHGPEGEGQEPEVSRTYNVYFIANCK